MSSGSVDWHAHATAVAHARAVSDIDHARVAELKRVHAEGRTADVGAANPYRGQRVNAAVWMGGYRRMLDDMIANSPVRRRWLASNT